jgi:hypothetical protein
VVDLQVFEVIEERDRAGSRVRSPIGGFFEAFVQVDGSDDGFQRIAEDLAHLEAAVEFIEIADLLQAHLDGDLIKLVAVDHLTAHFREKAFFLVGIFFEKEVRDDGAEDSVAKVFQSFVVLIGSVFYRSVGKGSPV